jgi:hypothetical protein
MTPRQIATNRTAVQCDVCGRSLLRGEHPAVFLAGGVRRTVCELCTPRAQHEGWIREGLGDEALGVRERGRERRGSFLQRLRGRRDGQDDDDGDAVDGLGGGLRRRSGRAAADEPLEAPVLPYADGDEPVYVAEVAPAVAPPPPPRTSVLPDVPREPRHVRAVPTNADMKRARAVDLFNASHHPRTVAALTRSLGAPFVVVRPSETEGSIVTVVVGWELTWYRYEVDLADEAAGVRQTAQGDELTELDPADHEPNAAADERGTLQLAAG